MRSRGLLAGVALSTAVAQLASVPAAAVPVETPCGPTLISHRGNVAGAAESTLPGYRKVLKAGVRVLEADVRFSSDGVPVVIHDATVDRTTDGEGLVASMPMRQLSRLDAGDGAKVPRLAALARMARRWRADLVLELKPKVTSRQVRDFVHILRAERMAGATVVQSFWGPNLNLVHERAAGIATGLIFTRTPAMATAVAAGSVVLPHLAMSTRRQVRRWHRAGLEVFSWTANRLFQWRALDAARVDAVMTDSPHRFLRWVRRGCR